MILLMFRPLQLCSEMLMPTYNYYCSNCDSHFSYFQQMSDFPLSTCEECGGKIERVITGGTGLIFKGSGFYLTDYKDKKKTESDTVKKDEVNTEKSKTDKKETKNNKQEKKSTSKKAAKSVE